MRTRTLLLSLLAAGIAAGIAVGIVACSGSGDREPDQVEPESDQVEPQEAEEQAEPQPAHDEHSAHGGPHPWTLRSEEELSAAIESAKAEARSSGRQVLLDFGAPWCPDCREVARLSTLDPALSTLRERYVVVHVDVGRWDRHRELLARYGIRRIATLVILNPETGERVAQTTMEPISERSGLNAEGLAEWLRSPS